MPSAYRLTRYVGNRRNKRVEFAFACFGLRYNTFNGHTYSHARRFGALPVMLFYIS